MKQRIFTLAILFGMLLCGGGLTIQAKKIKSRIYHIDPNCGLDISVIEPAFHHWNRRLFRDGIPLIYRQSVDYGYGFEPADLTITCKDSDAYIQMDSGGKLTREAKKYPNRLNALYVKLRVPYNVIVLNSLCLTTISHEINHDIIGSNGHNHPYFLFPRYHHHDDDHCGLNAMTIRRNLVSIQP